MFTCVKLPSRDADLVLRIASEIEVCGSIPFSRFMELALYDARDGYYASGRAAVGRAGDFFTNVSTGPLYGELLAGQLLEMRERLDGREFLAIEQGAHDGQMAADILDAIPAIHASGLRYVIVEPFPALRARQEEKLIGRAVEWVSSISDLPIGEGVHFSNELFDALPVDIVRSTGEGWRELCVGYESGSFVWRDGREVDERLPRRPVGYTTEIRNSHRPLLREISARLTRGFILAVDYGMSRDDLLAPHRTEGTLSCYRGHRRDSDPLIDPGSKDITAHVDFSGVVEDAECLGWDLAGFTDQHHFLVGAASQMLLKMDGIGPDAHAAKKIRALQTLIHPETMGTQFHALVLSRGVANPSLSGFQFARDPRERLFPTPV